MRIAVELEVHLLAPRLRDVRVRRAHEALLVAASRNMNARCAGRPRAEALLDRGDLLVAVPHEEARLRSRVVDGYTTSQRTPCFRRRVLRDRRRRRPMTELGRRRARRRAREHRRRGRAAPRDRTPWCGGRGRGREVDPSPRTSIDAKSATRERRQRAGAVREQRRPRVDHRVVERAAEVTDERVVREDHRRRDEATDADDDTGDRPRERDHDRDETDAPDAPRAFAARMSSPQAPPQAPPSTAPIPAVRP